MSECDAFQCDRCSLSDFDLVQLANNLDCILDKHDLRICLGICKTDRTVVTFHITILCMSITLINDIVP